MNTETLINDLIEHTEYAQRIGSYEVGHIVDRANELRDRAKARLMEHVAALEAELEQLKADNAKLRDTLAGINRLLNPSQSMREVQVVQACAAALARPACFNDLDPAKAEQRGCASCEHRKDCLPF